MTKLGLSSPPVGEFGNWLHERMTHADVSVRSLANGVGISPTAVSYHLHGQRRPTFAMVKDYCRYFGEDNVFYVYELTI